MTSRGSTLAGCIVAVGLATAGLAASFVFAADPEPLDGERLYRRYCSACHGRLADGDGPMRSALRVPPSDLTQLAARYGWPLPKEQLARFIDGRTEVNAHGSRDMPVWGRRLFEDYDPGARVEGAKSAVIWSILEYLESIQGGHLTDAGRTGAS